jgi:hypothetical protein
LLNRNPKGESFSSAGDDMFLVELLAAGRNWRTGGLWEEHGDARPDERRCGWLELDTQMHLKWMRLGLVNFFPKGARFVRQKLSHARRLLSRSRRSLDRLTTTCRLILAIKRTQMWM